jgi:hypothetical protein
MNNCRVHHAESWEHCRVPDDLLLDEVKCFFDPDVTGSLPDARVPDTSVEDWCCRIC